MLSIGTWVVLTSTTVIAAAYVVVTNLYRKKRKGEPDVVKGSPIFGSCIDFQTNAVDFLHNCRKDHGDVFTLRLINQYLTIIMDPHSYEAMSKERNFDFDPIQKQVNLNVFSFILKEPRRMLKDTARTVRGDFMVRAMSSYVNNLDIACNAIASTDEWREGGVRSFASKTLFDALFNQIFGRGDHEKFNSQNVYKNFETFHHYFNFLWLGFPKSWFPSATKALEDLISQPHSQDLLDRSDCSDYVKTAISYMKQQGQNEDEIVGHNLVYLHVNYNTFRLAFWVLANILENPEVEKALRQEIETAVEDALNEDNEATFTQKEIEALPILESVIQESTRLSSGVFMVRYIQKDTWFSTSSGKDYLMREGDRVAIYPPTIHKDPEIFEDPNTFKYDRFVDAKFYKNGQELKNPVIAFGSLCPGKRFALLQLKWYIINTLTRFDLRLKPGQHAEYDTQYYGHEILPSKADIDMHYRVRPHAPTLSFQ